MIHEIEKLLRAGDFPKASEILRKVNPSKISQDQRLAYVKAATRLGLLNLALRVLNPVIRGETKDLASIDEKIHYANLLRKLGAISEAQEILTSMNGSQNPEVLLNLAFCLMNEWKYSEAVPILKQFIELEKINSYQISIAKVNLLAAYVHQEEFLSAEKLIRELKVELSKGETSILLGNTLELQAQIAIHRREFDLAISLLEAATPLLNRAIGSADAIYIDKWLAVAKAQKAGFATDELYSIQKYALKNHQWETVRDCEFYIASLSKDEAALIKLYYETPFSSFREKVLKTGVTIPETWIKAENESDLKIFDLLTGEFSEGKISLEAGQALHRLLIVLCRDFYKPISTLSIFSQIYSGEHFNPNTSPNRTHQSIKRFRQWVTENKLGFLIEEIEGSYRLKINKPFAIRLPQKHLPLNHLTLEFMKLRVLLPLNEFTTTEVMTALSCSRSSAQRLLKWAKEEGKITLEGNTNHANYKLVA